MYQVDASQEGHDTLAKIASRFRVAGGYRALARLNGIDNPDLIHPGQVLRIPKHPPSTDALRPLPVIRQKLRPLRSCGKRFGKPRAAPVAADLDTVDRYCVSVAPRQQICKEASDDFDHYRITYSRGAQHYVLWSGKLSDEHYLRRFRVFAGDLDGNHRQELVVLDLQGITNGSGSEFYAVGVFDPLRPKETLVSFDHTVDDSRDNPTLLVRFAGEPTCSLIAVAPEPGAEVGVPLGVGNYSAARLYRYGQGQLHPRRDASIRWIRNGPNPGEPADDWRIPKSLAEEFSRPWVRGLQQEYAVTNLQVLRQQRGIVDSIQKTPRGVVLRLRAPGASRREVGSTLPYRLDPDSETYPQYDVVDAFGDQATQKLYPSGFRPSDREHWLLGRWVTITTYLRMGWPSSWTVPWR